jgi:hypothetical protein
VTSAFVGSGTRWTPDGLEPPPLASLVPRALMEVCDALTRTFVSASVSEMRVSRVDFSGPAQRCVCTLVQGVRGQMWPVGCGFEPGGCWRSPAMAPLRVHA